MARTPRGPISATDRAAERAAALARVNRAFEDAQVLKLDEEQVQHGDLEMLTESWKDAQLPELQRLVVDAALANLRVGIVDPVFESFARSLAEIDLPGFSLLDAACATGYYSEVTQTLDPRPIVYTGSDYSPSMIEVARAHYPEARFFVEDLTGLTFADMSFDVVLLAGVLEHVPDYASAIKEACRVARRALIVHRAPVTAGPAHEHTIGSQYNIRTPRTFFSKPVLLRDVADHGFGLQAEIPVYPARGSGVFSRLGERVRRAFQAGRTTSDRQTLTFVFRRT